MSNILGSICFIGPQELKDKKGIYMLTLVESFLLKFRSIFPAYFSQSLTEIIAKEMEQATKEREQALHTIRSQSFLKHMAEAKISALETWNKKGDF